MPQFNAIIDKYNAKEREKKNHPITQSKPRPLELLTPDGISSRKTTEGNMAGPIGWPEAGKDDLSAPGIIAHRPTMLNQVLVKVRTLVKSYTLHSLRVLYPLIIHDHAHWISYGVLYPLALRGHAHFIPFRVLFIYPSYGYIYIAFPMEFLIF